MDNDIKLLREKYRDLLYKRVEYLIEYDQMTKIVYKGLVVNIIGLIYPTLLSTNEIDILLKDSNSKMDFIIDALEAREFLIISDTIIKCEKEMTEDCLELDLFESCANITKFFKEFYLK